MINLGIRRFENTWVIWKSKGPTSADIHCSPTQRTIQGTGHELSRRAFLRVTRLLVSVTRPSRGFATFHSSPAPDSTRRPRPPVLRGNRQYAGSPVVSLRCPLRARPSLRLSSFPFHSFAPQFAARCRRRLRSRPGGGAAALRQTKPTSRSSNSVFSHGEIEGSWSRYIRLNSYSSQSRFGFVFVMLKFVAYEWFKALL